MIAAKNPVPQDDTGEFFQPGGKAEFVQKLFDRIAPRYDFLNTLTSFGMHKRWRARTVQLSGLKSGDTALDIACGTGDFLPGLRRQVGDTGEVIGLDFSPVMLDLAQDKINKRGVQARLVQGDAENLPFESESINTITIGFALRNFADVERCFQEACRVLVPGGRVLALEIARPEWWPYRPLFLFFFEKILPLLAGLFRGERKAYRWLPASLAAFYSREGVACLMKRAGFPNVSIHNLAGGAVCIYRGVKF